MNLAQVMAGMSEAQKEKLRSILRLDSRTAADPYKPADDVAEATNAIIADVFGVDLLQVAPITLPVSEVLHALFAVHTMEVVCA